MKPRLLLFSLGLTTLCMVLMAHAGDPPNQITPSNAAQIKDELIERQKQLARQFEDFRSQLLRLKQRLDKGTPEERSRASALGKLLDQIQKDGLAVQFDQLSEQLRESKLTNIPELKQMAERSAKLADKLRDYLEMFREDPRQKQLKEDQIAIEDFLKEVNKILDAEKRIQGLTEAGKTDLKELSKNQGKNAEKTNNLEKAIDKFLGKGDSIAKEQKDLKGGPKDGGKSDEAKAKTKDDGEKGTQTAQGQAKDAGDDKNESPKGGAKGDETAKDDKGDKGGDAQAKEGSPTDAKSKDGKGSDGQSQAKGNDGAKKDEAGAKNNDGAKSSEAVAKGGEESPKGNEAGTKGNEGPMANEASAKGSEGPMSPMGKEGSPKGSEAGPKGKEGAKSSEGQAKGAENPKAGGEPKASPSQAKAGEGAKAAEAGAKDAKGSESGSQAKAGGDPKGAPSKGAQGKAKAGSESKGQADAKGDGSKGAAGAPGKPSEASAKDDPPPSGGDPSAGGNPPPPGNEKTKDEIAKNQKKLKEAGYDMKNAEAKLAEKKPKQALAPEQDAIDKLAEMKKNLEKLLRQTREEELERLLAQLEARCRKMLEMQEQVLAGTEQTYKAVLTYSDKKPGRPEQLKALGLSDNEKDIISEANKAIQMLEEEGSAVAFPEVFQQVREDMKHVQRRLEIADTAEVTQAVEKDIIASLREMIDALKKAQKDLDQQKNGKPPEGQPPPNGDQKLLDKIAELKMIRSLQSRINDRTKFYGKLFPNEQAFDPNLRQQLQQLGERQERIFEIMDRFVKGDGK